MRSGWGVSQNFPNLVMLFLVGLPSFPPRKAATADIASTRNWERLLNQAFCCRFHSDSRGETDWDDPELEPP